MAMVKSQLSVPYSRALVDVCRTATDELVYINIDKVYRQYEVREKVIIRVDITKQLTAGILSDKADGILRKNYLMSVFGLVSNPDTLSEVFKELYIKDEQFKLFIGEICYFEMPSRKYTSLFRYLVDYNIKRREEVERDFGDRSSISSTGVFLRSLWHLYVGVNDKEDSVCVIPEEFKTEGISYAKKWNCPYPRAV